MVKLTPDNPKYPSHITYEVKLFDRFASLIARFTSKAFFFLFCLLVVVVWAPSYFLIGDVDTWQLIINTTTTIFTFLMVALLQNTQTRDTNAMHTKLNAMADGLADLADAVTILLPEEEDTEDLKRDIEELRAAVGVEHRESS